MTETSKIEENKLGSDVAARIASLPDIDTSGVEPHVEGTPWCWKALSTRS